MGYVARLRQGTRVLDLSSGRYQLYGDFLPPTTATAPNIAAGTSANRRGGGIKVGDRAQNREWAFMVRALGASTAEADRAIQDIDYFLQLAGDEAEPLYFEWLNNDDVGFQPLWGQTGVYRRLEVVHGSAHHAGPYFVKDIRSRAQIGQVELTIKPYALGSRQRVGSAAGGVLEDVIGTVDGRSRGVIVGEATTNLVANPVFGNATYDTSWTAGSDLVIAQNTAAEYVLFGMSSVKIIRAGGVNVTFAQSITAANTNTHAFSAYIKEHASAALTSTEIVLRYAGADLTTTFESLGNGWYRLRATAAGVASPQNFGVRLKTAALTVYADGFQMEEKAYVTPFGYGDLLGCSWSGTAHAAGSTSSRTAGRVRVASASSLEVAEGTVRLIWRTDLDDDDFTANAQFFTAGATSLRASFIAANDTITLSDNTNTITSGAQNWTIGAVLVLHFVYEPGRLEIYLNGASLISGATYTPPTLGNDLYIGTSAAAGNHLNGTLMGCTTYARAMSAAEVLADYNDMGQVAADGQRVDWIPWLWTKDGDDTVDNCDDTNRDNWCVAGGIPGSAPAATRVRGDLSDTFRNLEALFLSNWHTKEFYSPTSYLNKDENDTVTGATDSGGAVTNTTINAGATATLSSLALTLTPAGFRALGGQDVRLFARMNDAGTQLRIRFRLLVDSAEIASSALTNVVANANKRFKWTEGLTIPSLAETVLDDLGVSHALTLRLIGDRAAAGANGSVGVDFIQAMPRPLVRIEVGNNGTRGHFAYDSQPARALELLSNYDFAGILYLTGDALEFWPDEYNHLIAIQGDSDVNADITWTLEYEQVYVTPRWAIL